MKDLRTLLIAAAVSLSSAVFAAEAAPKPELHGYCPVAYGLAGKAVKGVSKYSSTYKGHLYYFASEGAKKAFDEHPEKFPIAYGSWCATGIAYGHKVASDPTLFVVRDGVTYLFSNEEAKKAFEADPAGTVAKAQANWPKLK